MCLTRRCNAARRDFVRFVEYRLLHLHYHNSVLRFRSVHQALDQVSQHLGSSVFVLSVMSCARRRSRRIGREMHETLSKDLLGRLPALETGICAVQYNLVPLLALNPHHRVCLFQLLPVIHLIVFEVIVSYVHFSRAARRYTGRASTRYSISLGLRFRFRSPMILPSRNRDVMDLFGAVGWVSLSVGVQSGVYLTILTAR